MKKVFLTLSLLIFIQLNAQEPFYRTYSWDLNPNYKNYDVNQAEDLIAFKEKTASEFYFLEKNSLVEFYLEHKLLWVNSDDKIEAYNKIYLPYSSTSELLVNKARVIKKNGEIIELDDAKILTAQNEETQQTYKYFALEGLEKGSFIEYYYVVKKYPDYKGNKVTLQSSYAKNNIEFDVFAPKNLVFKFKSYNNLPTVELDTLTKEKNHWKLYVNRLEKLEDEDKSPYNSLKKYVVYKLETNTASSTNGISSYSNVSKNLYNYLFKELDKKEVSDINNLVKETGIATLKDDASKVRTLENYIKRNFYYSEINSEELSNISSVIENKAGNENGLIRVYIATLKSVNVPTEIVLTCNRFETKFDNEFEADNFLLNYLLYFPTFDQYTSPGTIESRLGFPPAELTDNYGLFVKEITIGTYKSGVGKIKYISPPTDKETFDNMEIEVQFNPIDLSQNIIKIDRTFGGYFALYIQPFLNMIPKDELDKVYDEFIKAINENLIIKDKTPYNDNPDLFGIKPFRIVANVESEAFVDKAGTKYLFKIGELIGTQLEMYQEKNRILTIEDEYNRSYERTISVEIPLAYKISNLEDLNIHHFYENESIKQLEFHSFYKLEGNKLIVNVNEYYKINKIEIPVFEDYKKVVNSAADFNKIVLILEPKI